MEDEKCPYCGASSAELVAVEVTNFRGEKFDRVCHRCSYYSNPEMRASFLDKLQRAAEVSAERHRKFRKNMEANWAEDKLIGEIYHELRNSPVDYDHITLEQPHGKRRHDKKGYGRFDLFNINEKVAIQVVPYLGRLPRSKLDDLKLFHGLDSDFTRVLIVANVGEREAKDEDFPPIVKERLEAFKEEGGKLIKC